MCALARLHIFFCTFPSVIGHSQIVFVLAIETFTVCTFTEDVEKQVVNIFVKFYVKDELSLEMLIYNFIYLFIFPNHIYGDVH